VAPSDLRAIVHAASTEVRTGRIVETDVEAAMLRRCL
jgi:hypothetical protein